MYFATAAAILIFSVLIDLVFADPPTSCHPVGWQGRYISAIWRRRRARSDAGLFLYGLSILISGLLITGLIAGLIMVLVNRFAGTDLMRVIPGIILISLMLKGSFSYRGLLRAGAKVRAAIDEGDIEEGRKLVSYHLVSRPTGSLSESGVNSAVIESLAENFTDSVASPLFWYGIGGPAAAWCFRYVNTADAMLGYREGDREWGGKSAAVLDDILNWIPARIAGWVIVSAAFFRRLNVREAAGVMLRDSRNCASPNSGWTMAAAAGAMGIRLEKEGHYVLNAAGRAPLSSDIGVLKGVLNTSLLLWMILVTFGLFLSATAMAIAGVPVPAWTGFSVR